MRGIQAGLLPRMAGRYARRRSECLTGFYQTAPQAVLATIDKIAALSTAADAKLNSR